LARPSGVVLARMVADLGDAAGDDVIDPPGVHVRGMLA
jgi:hypothetical protein